MATRMPLTLPTWERKREVWVLHLWLKLIPSWPPRKLRSTGRTYTPHQDKMTNQARNDKPFTFVSKFSSKMRKLFSLAELVPHFMFMTSALAFWWSTQNFYFSHFTRVTVWMFACLLITSLTRGKYTIIHTSKSCGNIYTRIHKHLW